MGGDSVGALSPGSSRALRDIGVNLVALNLKYGTRPADELIEEVGREVLPHARARLILDLHSAG